LKKKTTKTTRKSKKKMPPKDLKVTDVAKPGKTAPPATARPIIVTNRPVLANDPMIVNGPNKQTAARTAPLVSRTAKTIKPIATAGTTESQTDVLKDRSPDQSASDESVLAAGTSPGSVKEDKPASVAASVTLDSQPPVTDTVVESADQLLAAPKSPEPASRVSTPTKSSEEDVVAADKDITEKTEADISAAQSEAEAAEETHRQTLEKLAEAGTYAVPINAVQRKRSRAFVATMCVIALVLALAVADLVLDANLVQAPDSVPHTHFFSGN
jgi:hypothetical protein